MLGVPGGVPLRLGVTPALDAVRVAGKERVEGEVPAPACGCPYPSAGIKRPRIGPANELEIEISPPHAPVPSRVCDGVTVPALDLVSVPVTCGDPVDDRVAGLDWECAAVPVEVGVTGTHAPHANPGNPGAPGTAATALYPTSHAPAHATPHDV